MSQASNEEDAALLARIGAKDRAAFATLAARHLPSLLRYAGAISSHAIQAEDAVQEAFTTLWREVSGGREILSLKAWLRVVVRHALLKELRHGAHESPEEDLESIESLAGGAGWGASDDALTAKRLEDRDLVRHVVAGLSAEDRDVLYWVDVDGFSVEEAASALGASLAATKSRLHRARLRFMRGVRSAEEGR